MRNEAKQLIYLTGCVLHQLVPTGNWGSSVIDYKALYSFAQKQQMTGMLAYALLQTDPCTGQCPAQADKLFWEQVYARALLRQERFNHERRCILEYMEANGIWFALLKGAVLQSYYPDKGLREMSDNDILFDEAFSAQICAYMQSKGYTALNFGETTQDAYRKSPIYNFEFHRKLFEPDFDPRFTAFFENIQQRLIPDVAHPCLLHFSDEEFYIYFIAHAYKNYQHRGVGLRTLVDLYLILQKKSFMDRAYISAAFAALGLSDFAAAMEQLAKSLFCFPNEAEQTKRGAYEESLLSEMIFCGVHGSKALVQERMLQQMLPENTVIDRSAKRAYFRKRLFPGLAYMRESSRLVAASPLLLPLGYCERCFRAVFSRRKKIQQEMRRLDKIIERHMEK